MRQPDPERESEGYSHLAWEMRWQMKRARKIVQDARRRLREQAPAAYPNQNGEDRSPP